MRLREHIPYLLERVYIPVGNVLFPHSLHHLVRDRLSFLVLPDHLHDLEGHALVESELYKVEHYAVSGPYDLGEVAYVVVYEILRVSEPHSFTVGQARHLDKVREVLGLRMDQNGLYEARAQFRDAQGTGLAVYELGRLDPERFRSGEEPVHVGIVHFDVEDARAGESLQSLVFSRYIVPELVELQYGLVKITESEVCSYGL